MQGLQPQLFLSTDAVLLHQMNVDSHEWQRGSVILHHIKYREQMLTKPKKVVVIFIYVCMAIWRQTQ